MTIRSASGPWQMPELPFFIRETIPPLKVVRTRGNVALEGGLGSRHDRKIPGSGGSEARLAFGMPTHDRNASALAL